LAADCFRKSHGKSLKGRPVLHAKRWKSPGSCLGIRDIIEEQYALSGRQIKLLLPSHPAILQTDEKHLRQAIVNMVDNAIKYSPDHTAIQLSVQRKPAHVVVSRILRARAEGKAGASRMRLPFSHGSSYESSITRSSERMIAVSPSKAAGGRRLRATRF